MSFIRIAKLEAGNKIIEFPDAYFEWSYEIKNDNSPGMLEIDIYNHKTTFKDIKIDDGLVLQIGYEDEGIGQFFEGFISNISTTKSNGSNITSIEALESKLYHTTKISRSYSKYVQASYILNDIITRAGFSVKSLKLKNDKTYENGYTVYGNAHEEIKKIVNDCSSKVTVSGKVYKIYSEESEKTSTILLDYSSGLKSEPLKNTDKNSNYDYEVESLVIRSLKKGDVFKIESNSLNSFVRILELNISGWTSKYKVKVM